MYRTSGRVVTGVGFLLGVVKCGVEPDGVLPTSDIGDDMANGVFGDSNVGFER